MEMASEEGQALEPELVCWKKSVELLLKVVDWKGGASLQKVGSYGKQEGSNNQFGKGKATF